MSEFRSSFPNNRRATPDDEDAPTGRLDRVPGWPYGQEGDRLPGVEERTEQFPSVSEARPEPSPGWGAPADRTTPDIPYGAAPTPPPPAPVPAWEDPQRHRSTPREEPQRPAAWDEQRPAAWDQPQQPAAWEDPQRPSAAAWEEPRHRAAWEEPQRATAWEDPQSHRSLGWEDPQQHRPAAAREGRHRAASDWADPQRRPAAWDRPQQPAAWEDPQRPSAAAWEEPRHRAAWEEPQRATAWEDPQSHRSLGWEDPQQQHRQPSAWEDPQRRSAAAWEDPQRAAAWSGGPQESSGRHAAPAPAAAEPTRVDSAFWGTSESASEPAPATQGSDDGWSFWERPKRTAPPEPRPSWEEILRQARAEQEAAEREAAERERLEEEREAAAKARRRRDPYLDNAKFFLISLVVIGHSLVPTLSAHSSRSLYLYIYVFHMPLFVIISGYLSRNFWNSNAKTNKLVDTFLVPYVIVEVGYALLRVALGEKWSLTIMDPAWLNWYLLALLLWRLSTPVWKRMRHPLLFALAVYLLSGLADLSGDFSIDRFFTLMPFFVLGLCLQPSHFEWLNQLWVKIAAVFVLIGAAGVAIYLAPRVKLGPIYYKNDYATLGLTWWEGMAQRMALLVAALLMSAAVLALIPRRRTWFSDLGTRTLYAYLLHGVPVMIAKKMGWLSFPWMFGPLGVLTISVSGFVLAVILCLPQTRAVFKYLIEPRLTWLYRKPSRPAASQEQQPQQPAVAAASGQGQAQEARR